MQVETEMAERPIPYIGITDFTHYDQVKAMLQAFHSHLPRSRFCRRKLHVGVMMSAKTLRGIPTRWADVFPPAESIAQIFTSFHSYNCLHYADYGYDEELAESLSRAIGYGGIGMNALQLDMIWPDPNEIALALYDSRKQLEVILQLNENAIHIANDDPREVVERLEDYGDTIQRVLLDKSMGRGVGMDSEGLIPFIDAITEKLPNLGIGVAGGLGPDTLNQVEPLVKAYPDLSIDAQSKLRPSGDAMDPLDLEMAKLYLVRAIEMFYSYAPS